MLMYSFLILGSVLVLDLVAYSSLPLVLRNTQIKGQVFSRLVVAPLHQQRDLVRGVNSLRTTDLEPVVDARRRISEDISCKFRQSERVPLQERLLISGSTL